MAHTCNQSAGEAETQGPQESLADSQPRLLGELQVNERACLTFVVEFACLVGQDRVSQCSADYSKTTPVDQAGL